ncbi:MAG: DUF2726 domain-containing protein [Kangiellaceae bacterium]|nr:DUF2726 domain-containing protein [Kangiellaceae bacterium]
MFDREELFQLLAAKDWDNIAKIMYRNPELIGTDPIILQAINLFENEFFKDVCSLGHKEKLSKFEYPGIVIELKSKSFSDTFVSRFVDEKLKTLKALNSDKLFNYASSHQESKMACDILIEIQTKKPEVVSDAIRQNTSIKSTRTRSGKRAIVKLFKSKQEENFFEAIRQAFPTYHPYPNVALSSVIDFDAIKNDMNAFQKEYFFRSVIDSVVFDSGNGYIPMHFVELDSVFHDNEKAQKNDKLKDEIFEIANLKLVRIRPFEREDASIESFKRLVIEVMRDL